MATETFLRLPEAKRSRITAAAIAEFATNVFADARLDRIAEASGVSKGSLFQYFADKDDFYVFAVEAALSSAWDFYERHVGLGEAADCFELLAETMLSMAALKRRKPHLAALYLRVVYAKDSHHREQLYRTFVRRNEDFMARLVPWGLETGHIDPALPEAVVRFHIHAVGSHLTYLVLSGDDPRWLPRSDKRLRPFVFETVAVLARALAPTTTRSRSGQAT